MFFYAFLFIFLRMVFAQTKKGFIIPCLLTTKIVPNLDLGIQAIGFLQNVESMTNSINYEEDV